MGLLNKIAAFMMLFLAGILGIASLSISKLCASLLGFMCAFVGPIIPTSAMVLFFFSLIFFMFAMLFYWGWDK